MTSDAADHNPVCDCLEMSSEVVDRVDVPVDRCEVLRYLGSPANAQPNSALTRVLDHWIAEAELRAKPRAIFGIYPIVEIDKRSLSLKNEQENITFRGAIGEFLGVSRQISAFIATAGPDVEQLATRLLQEGDPLAAMIVSGVGSERAEAAEQVVIEKLRSRAAKVGFAPTLPYSPGYCGMELTEQTKLFALLEGRRVGVSLSSSCLMNPIKSVSGLIGLGPADQVQQYGSPCDRCDIAKCDMRRDSLKTPIASPL